MSCRNVKARCCTVLKANFANCFMETFQNKKMLADKRLLLKGYINEKLNEFGNISEEMIHNREKFI